MSERGRQPVLAGESPVEATPLLMGIRARHALWFDCAMGFAALAVVCLLMLAMDERALNGVNVWAKPLKFSISLAVYFATLAWFAPLMPDGYFAGTGGRWLSAIPVACAVFEIVYIIVQAALGEPSHFNVSTTFHSTMYTLMGGGAFILVAICLWMGLIILSVHRMSNPYALSVGLALVLTFVLGGGFGAYLGGQTGHWVGGTLSDADGLWLVNWSRDGGDLRVPHFFGMHAMQILPALATLVPHRMTRDGANVAVLAMTLLYAASAGWTFQQAVSGIPFAG
jgi:hypothetical protein